MAWFSDPGFVSMRRTGLGDGARRELSSSWALSRPDTGLLMKFFQFQYKDGVRK